MIRRGWARHYWFWFPLWLAEKWHEYFQPITVQKRKSKAKTHNYFWHSTEITLSVTWTKINWRTVSWISVQGCKCMILFSVLFLKPECFHCSEKLAESTANLLLSKTSPGLDSILKKPHWVALGRRSGLALDSGSLLCSLASSPGRGTALFSWAKHFTLMVPLFTQLYKWVPAILMLGGGGGGNRAMHKYPTLGGVEILPLASC